MANLISKENLQLGAIVGLASIVLAFLFSGVLSGFGTTITFAAFDINVREQLEAGIAETDAGVLADKLLSSISGVIPGDFQNLIIVFFAGFLMVIFGKFVLSLTKFKFKTDARTLWGIMTIGTLALAVLVSHLSILSPKFISTFIGLGLYFAIVTATIQLGLRQKFIPAKLVKI